MDFPLTSLSWALCTRLFQDGIGQDWIPYGLMPVLQGKLACHRGGLEQGRGKKEALSGFWPFPWMDVILAALRGRMTGDTAKAVPGESLFRGKETFHVG